ncbi:MAG: hypothetical protein RR754_07855 [Oscillospiraceae bacterium]
MEIIKRLKSRYNMAKNNTKLCFYEKDEKKYLAVVKTNWRGVKWARHFCLDSEIIII